jgi:hypothetical protein
MTALDGPPLAHSADPMGMLDLADTDDTLCSAPGCPITPILGEHMPGTVYVGQAGYAECTTDQP